MFFQRINKNTFGIFIAILPFVLLLQNHKEEIHLKNLRAKSSSSTSSSSANSSSNNSNSSSAPSRSTAYITSWGNNFSGDDRIWGRNGVKLSNGSTIYTWLQRENYGSRCYQLFVQGAFHGSGSNCSNNINNSWSVSCGDSGQFWVQGTQTDVVKAIVKRCGN